MNVFCLNDRAFRHLTGRKMALFMSFKDLRLDFGPEGVVTSLRERYNHESYQSGFVGNAY